jgi:hypothetical protein
VIRRELAIAFRAPLTWVQAALSALLVGHGFVLAVDLYSAGSRSVATNALVARQFDPLLGIVRPTLGGLYLALSLLGPITAARGLAIEKERHAFSSLLLMTGAPTRVCLAKLCAALAAVALQLVAPASLLVAWCAVGGHLGLEETLVALFGHAAYLLLVSALAVAAAAWTGTLAQAAVVALIAVTASWAIDASEGFSALAWLGRALDWSVTTHLTPMERGTLAPGALLWILAVASGAVGLALVGTRYDWSPARRGVLALLVGAASLNAAAGAHQVRRVLDLTELHRASLPPATEAGLRALAGPIRITIELDRDDARRSQLEVETLSKLRIARSDLEVSFPPDERPAPAEAERPEGYGRIRIEAAAGERSTYSSSPEEIVRSIFEAAGAQVAASPEPDYPGHPLVVEGVRRSLLVGLSYFGIPAALLAAGGAATRFGRRRRT